MLTKPEKILLWSSNLWMFGAGMLGPLFAVFVEQIGGDILNVSWAYATYLIVTGIGIFLVGKLSDRIGQEWLMISGYALSALATFGYLLMSDTLGLLVIQVLQGIALALSQPTWLALYDKFSGDGKSDGYIWGLSSGMGYVASGFAIIFGGYVVNAYSFDFLFIIMGTILIASTIYQATILRYRHHHQKSSILKE